MKDQRPPPRWRLRPMAVALGVALALGTTVSASRAQGGPTDAKRAQAKVLFDEGASLYTQGSYEEALAKWEKAYELSEEPLIFENMANAYERLGELDKAYEHLLLWREVAPASEHATLDARLKNLQERIDRKKREADPETKEEPKDKPPPIRDGGADVSIPGLILTGVGVAAVAGGIAVGVVAAGQRPEEAEVCRAFEERSLCAESSRDDIDTSTTLAAVSDLMWIGGAVTGTVGVVLLLTYEPDGGPGTGTLGVRPMVGASGLTVEGTW